MCGIAGILSKKSSTEDLQSIAQMMGQKINHRGPDANGTWVDSKAGVALSHQRLSINDLSPSGAQPMHSPSERFVLSFNGEIYNFQDIRKVLTKEGFTFKGHSDTEVLLTLIEQRGLEDTLKMCHGVFAIALWDKKESKLHLTRDRIGEKPLYYGWINQRFVFSSELAALECLPFFDGNISREALGLLLQFNCVPAPHSIYTNVSKLTPGTILTLKWDGTSTQKISTYWSVKDRTNHGRYELPESFQETANFIDDKLSRIIQWQMISDVQLGAFLSGGLDSSLIVAKMQESSKFPIKTFTMGFEDPTFDESQPAKAVANHLGTDHTEVIVTNKMALDLVPRLGQIYSEPFADSSQIPTLMVCQIAGANVKVCLSGDGGDEVFGGYTRYLFGETLWNQLKYSPALVRKFLLKPVLQGLEKTIPSAEFAGFRLPKNKIRKLMSVLNAQSKEEFYLKLLSHHHNPHELVKNLDPQFKFKLDAQVQFNKTDVAQGMAELDMQLYLPDDILVKTDRASMSTGLEIRVPFLDHELIEISLNIPTKFKIQNNKGKQILRHILDKKIPRELIDRPKMGFAVPIFDWLREDLKQWAEHLLDETTLRNQGFLNEKAVRKMWSDQQKGNDQWSFLLWNILMFQSWLEPRINTNSIK